MVTSLDQCYQNLNTCPLTSELILHFEEPENCMPFGVMKFMEIFFKVQPQVANMRQDIGMSLSLRHLKPVLSTCLTTQLVKTLQIFKKVGIAIPNLPNDFDFCTNYSVNNPESKIKDRFKRVICSMASTYYSHLALVAISKACPSNSLNKAPLPKTFTEFMKSETARSFVAVYNLFAGPNYQLDPYKKDVGEKIKYRIIGHFQTLTGTRTKEEF